MEGGPSSPAGRIAGDDTGAFGHSIEFLVTEEHVVLSDRATGGDGT